MEIGESWAYRARSVDPLVEVVVVRIGTQKKLPRVLIHFTDATYEGREEWVTPGRLKVPWAEAEGFIAREHHWNLIQSASLPRDDPRTSCADTVMRLLIDSTIANASEYGILRIAQPGRLTAQLGLEMDKLRDHPAVFEDDGALMVPWPITELIVTTAAKRDPGPILEEVEEDERSARYQAIHGNCQYGYSPEHCVIFDLEYNKPRRDILRDWCGVEAVERYDELTELRKEVKRLGALMETAIDVLRSAGHASEAARLQREFGTPVEMLRAKDPTAL